MMRHPRIPPLTGSLLHRAADGTYWPSACAAYRHIAYRIVAMVIANDNRPSFLARARRDHARWCARLARWLRWRDSRIAATAEKDGGSNARQT